jgi:hypothetical protein
LRGYVVRSGVQLRGDSVTTSTFRVHLQTHLMSGWCVGNLLPLGARERLFCMIAAAASDLDGIGRVFGEEAYWRYHHVVGHNLAFAISSRQCSRPSRRGGSSRSPRASRSPTCTC